MTTALIFAGGTGLRMNTRSKPKQFLELHGKPVIIYTIEHFERHNEIDDIVVVCLESWIPELKRLLGMYGIVKVSDIVPGGDGGDRSIYNGLSAMSVKRGPDDIVLIHDGVRPLISAELISANIEKAKECGTAITAEKVTETVMRVDADGLVSDIPPRREMYTAKAPQTFKYGLIWDLYRRANRDGMRAVDSADLCRKYDIELRIVKSTPNNMKITAPQDYYIFRALYEAMENQQIFGF